MLLFLLLFSVMTQSSSLKFSKVSQDHVCCRDTLANLYQEYFEKEDAIL